MIREMENDDVGIIVNYLYEEYENVPSGKSIVLNLKNVLLGTKYRYVVETEDGIIVGYYVYREKTPYTAVLSSAFIAPKYRHSKYLLEMYKHGAARLCKYKVVKCLTAYSKQLMPIKYFNAKRKTFDMKKLNDKVN